MTFSLPVLFKACALGITYLTLLPANLKKMYQAGGLLITFIAVALGFGLYGKFSVDTVKFQFLSENPWLQEVNIDLGFGLDGISLVFLALTAVIFPFCVLACWKTVNAQFLFINLLLIEFFLILTFSTLDLFLFCLFFESLLIPMFFIILLWGSRDRRIKALTYFVLYTLFGSIFLITALFMVYAELNSTSFGELLANNVLGGKQSIFWMLLFITFSIKIPMFPFHIWLPEAHVEAPTVGSVILAGLLLKLGAYGMLRFLFVFDYAKVAFQPYVFALCLISIYLASFIAVRQLDMKRIIAYSSIAHMNFALLGYFSNNLFGLTGGTLLMVSHGLVSSALFLLIGVLYERYHTRSVLYYGGLVIVMPLFAALFFVFTISNFSFPGTSNFIGEIVTILGLGMTPNKLVLILGAFSTFFGLVYSLLLYNRVTFGNLKYLAIQKFTDVTRREFGFLIVLALFSTAMGFVPNVVIEPITSALTALAHNTTAAFEAFLLQSVDVACSYHAATTISLEEIPTNARLFAEIHNLAVTSDPNTILTWEQVYKHCLEKLPILMAGVTLANFNSVAFTSFEEFIAYGLKNGILHFSEVTYCAAVLAFMGKLPLYVISNNHFWLAVYSIISHATGPISIAATYEFLRNLSSHPCLPAHEFWALLQTQLVDYIQYLIKVGDVAEIRHLVQVLSSVNWPPMLMMWNYFIYFWMFIQGVAVLFIGLIIYKVVKSFSNKKPKGARKWKYRF